MGTTILPPQLFIHRLERRRSTHPHNHPLTEKLHRLDPTVWLAPAVLRAHDAHEYRKDRRLREDIYRSHHQQQRRRAEEQARVHRDGYRDNRVFYSEGGGGGGAFSHAKTMSSTTGTASTGTMVVGAPMTEVWRPSSPMGWESVVGGVSLRRSRKSEMSLNDRARALEWMGSTSVFSPGVLQDWMLVSDDELWEEKAMGLGVGRG